MLPNSVFRLYVLYYYIHYYTSLACASSMMTSLLAIFNGFEVVFVSIASAISERLAFARPSRVKVKPWKGRSARAHRGRQGAKGRLGKAATVGLGSLGAAPLMALVLGGKVVGVALAPAPSEFLARSGLCVVIPTGHHGSARAHVTGQGTEGVRCRQGRRVMSVLDTTGLLALGQSDKVV